jgi:hypothetical protein
MMSEDVELQGSPGAPEVPDWLKGLIRAVRSEAIQPKDGRVKSLWDLLKQRQLLARSVWLRALLRRMWDRGLEPRPRPRTTQRLVRRLRLWGILPAPAERPASGRLRMVRPGKPAVVRPMRPVAVRPLRPVSVRPVGPAGTRG